MAVRSAFIFLLVTGYCYAASKSSRIVGGELTTIEKYPAIVQVENYSPWTGWWAQACGANILTTRYVLSAAHCFKSSFYQPSYRRIRAGSTWCNTGGQIVYVEVDLQHPTYGLYGSDGDIAVVKLLGELVYTPVVQKATIIAQNVDIPDNAPVVHAGWGLTSVGWGATESEQLRDVTIYTISNKLCQDRYLELERSSNVTENMICAGILDVGGKDACYGDSGGPLYYQNILVGIVAWGHGCANDTYPGLSTRVASYTNWIIGTAV